MNDIRKMIDKTRFFINENEKKENYNKFPLSALIKQAKKFKDFKDFSKFYALDLNHGYYWHLTDNKDFKISDESGPRDMSSMASGGISEKGAIMLTGDLEYWDEHYNMIDGFKKDVKRNYVVLFDASDIDPKFLKQVGRGFGNEMYFDSNIAKQLKQIGVYPLKYAKSLNNKFHKMIPGIENELFKLWKFANDKQ